MVSFIHSLIHSLTEMQPTPSTRAFLVKEGGFKYDSDSYADDLPYWTLDHGPIPHLIVPYTMVENDAHNEKRGEEFGKFLKDT
jgi:allantoinase